MDELSIRQEVAWGCRILAMRGYGDLTLGHLSTRDENYRIYIKRKDLALREVTADDVITIDMDGDKLSGDGESHLEAALHTEVYRARDDVRAVVHSHPLYATALAATDAKLEMLTHDAVLFHDGIRVFEDTPDLITMPDQGKAVAEALGSRRAVLMRNHGVLLVGEDVRWAILGAITLERAVQFQVLASQLGRLHPMPIQGASDLFPSKYREEFIQPYWDFLIREARRTGYADEMPA